MSLERSGYIVESQLGHFGIGLDRCPLRFRRGRKSELPHQEASRVRFVMTFHQFLSLLVSVKTCVEALRIQLIEIIGVFSCKHNHQQYLHKNPNGYCGLSGCFDSENQKVLFPS